MPDWSKGLGFEKRNGRYFLIGSMNKALQDLNKQGFVSYELAANTCKLHGFFLEWEP